MSTLKVLTLNVWGLYYLAQKIKERLGFIADELKQYDIVGLQEVWSRRDYKFLMEKLRDHLPYSHHFHRGIIGSGLCVFSRHPIVSAHTHEFNVNGSLYEVRDGEIFVGKGIMFCRIKTPEGNIAFYNTHTNPRNRDSQLFEVFQFVEQTRGNQPVILMGDLNTKSKHLAYSILTKCLRLEDVYSDDPVDTCDLTTNIFTEKRMTPKRIDFILFSDGQCDTLSLSLLNRRLSVSGNIPGMSFPYSDHEGVEASFLLKKRDSLYLIPEQTFDDTALQVFIKISDNMMNTKKKFQTNSCCVISYFVLLFVIFFLMTFVLSNHTLFTFLALYNLHWLPTLVMGLLSVLSVVSVVTTLSSLQVFNSLEANLSELQAVLNYQSTKRGQ